MKRVTTALVLTVALAAAWAVVAGEGEKRHPSVSGKVQAVDAQKATITLVGRTKEGQEVDPAKTYPLAPNAKVQIDGEAKTLQDVPAGAQVTLGLSDDQQTVTTVTLRTKKEEGGRQRGARHKVVAGQLTKVDAGSLTVTRRGDSGERSETVSLDTSAKVTIQTDEDEEVKGEGGKVSLRPKLKDGTVSDLKPGQYVSVTCTEDGKTAVRVMVLRAPKPREGREGK